MIGAGRKLGELLLGRSGIASLARFAVARDGRFVLMLHGVSHHRRHDIAEAAQPVCDRDELRRILAWLGARFAFLEPQQLLAEKRPGVLLTFDDGLLNNFENALPVLEECQAPAVFFVTTRHVISPDDWLPSCRDQASITWRDPSTVPEEIAREFYRGLTPDAVRACARHPLITVGSHTVSHPFLTRCGDEELERELRESKSYLETLTGQSVDLLAYPTGDYDQRVAESAERCGYRAAFAVDGGIPGISPAFQIPRIGIYYDRPGYLALKLSGLHRPPLRGRPPLAPS